MRVPRWGSPSSPNAFLPPLHAVMSPAARLSAWPPSRGENKAKQSSPGSKYYLDTKERYVSLYGSRISAF